MWGRIGRLLGRGCPLLNVRWLLKLRLRYLLLRVGRLLRHNCSRWRIGRWLG